jgi:hypothetical protein
MSIATGDTISSSGPRTRNPGTPQRDLGDDIRNFAARLKKHYSDEITRDPRGFKHRAVHWLKRCLPPGPGRPCDRTITLALEMRRRGREWREIYPRCIERRETLDSASRQLAQLRLRDACRSRRNARRRRKPGRNSSARNIPPDFVSSGAAPRNFIPSKTTAAHAAEFRT